MTLEGKYGVPTVAIHTDKFDRVVRSVAAVSGMPGLRQVFVPQPIMGKTARELRAYVDGVDPITGRPVMQEVVEGLTRPFAAGEESPARFDRSTPRLVAARHARAPRAALSRQPLDGRASHRAAHRGAGGRHAGGHAAEGRRGGRPPALHAFPRALGVHGGEGGGERGDGGGAPRVLPRHPRPRRHRGHRAQQQLERDGDHGGGERPRSPRDRDERGHGRDGPLRPRQRHHRPRLRPPVAESPGRIRAGPQLHGQSREQLRVQQRHLRGERGAEPLGALPRGARSRGGGQRGERVLGLPLHRLHAGAARAALARARGQPAARHGAEHPADACCSIPSRRGSSWTGAAS